MIKETKDKNGQQLFLVSISRGHGKSKVTRSWRPDPKWTPDTVKRRLKDFEHQLRIQVESGELLPRKEAREKAEREAKEAEIEAAKLKTVRQYTDGVFMPTKEATFSENARSSYRMYFDKHIFPVIGDVLLVEIKPAMITKMLIDFQKAGYAHASCVKLYNILNGVFTMAFLDDSIPTNPMLKVKRPAARKDEQAEDESVKALTVQELNHVLECAKAEPLKWEAYINLAADSWCRRGESCGLKWQDIDFDAGKMKISRNLQYTPKQGIYATSPKNGKCRTVDIGPETVALLRQLRQEQAKSCISQWVFTQDGTAEPMHPQSPTRYFKKFSKKYDIPDFHPHILRHTGASIAITNGADVVSVSERLGHSDTAVTLRMYAHANEESIGRAGQTVRNALKSAK